MDDLLVTGLDVSLLNHAKTFLGSAFSIKDLGPIQFFLRVEGACTSRGFYLSQCRYVFELLYDTDLFDARPVSTPLPKGLKLVA